MPPPDSSPAPSGPSSPGSPDRPAAPDAGPVALAALAAVLTLATLELVRASGPLLDMAFGVGVTAAAGAALATYALPGLLAVGLVAAGRRAPLAAAVVGAIALAVARLALQGVTAGVRFGVGLAAVALAVAALTLAVGALAGRHGGRAAARAVALGLAGAVGLQLALGTWDAVWRRGVLGWAVAALLAAGLLATAWGARQHARGPVTAPGRLWPLGLALGLAAMIAANPGFAASQSDTPLALAGPVVGLGWLLTAWDRRPAWTDAVVLPVLVAGAFLAPQAGWAPLTLLLLVALPLATTAALGAALEPRPAAGPVRPWQAAGAASLVGLGVILPVLVYQLDYDIPLPFPNWLVPVAAAAGLGVVALRAARAPVPDGAAPRRQARPLLVGAAALLVLGTAVGASQALRTGPASAGADDADVPVDPTLTLVSWNLHYGVDPAGAVDLEQIARTIEAQGPDVVTLQEVSRGWVQGGGADMATWLAQRLGMHVAFAPAADRQFGNAVLTRLDLGDVSVLELPYGAGPQRRSAVSADVTWAGGALRFTSVHVQHREENTPTRLDQIGELLDAERGRSDVIAGDLNAEPGWAEIDLLTEAGYVSAVDEAGDPDALTSPSTGPRHRIDWVFTRGRLTPVEATVLTDALASDHLPIVVELATAPPG